MKKILLVLGVIMMSFAISSCDPCEYDVDVEGCYYCEQTRTEMDNNEWIEKLISTYSYCNMTENEIIQVMKEGTYMDNYHHYKYNMECIKIIDDTK